MIELIAAPSNLGLRPLRPGHVPGTATAPDALRASGLWQRLDALDGGAVLPAAYSPTVHPGHVRNEDALVDHARRLADRLGASLEAGHAPLVIGGDCSLLVGVGVALARRGRSPLVHIDGHTDFRHPGNSDAVASVAGEDLAAAVGLHWPAISDIDGLGPYFDPAEVAHIGCRDDNEEIAEARSRLALVSPASAGVPTIPFEQFWLHLDVDVLDPSFMPAVDSPDPGGFSPDELVRLLRSLAPRAIGAQVTVFDPDLDPTGEYAALLTDVIVEGLASVGSGL